MVLRPWIAGALAFVLRLAIVAALACVLAGAILLAQDALLPPHRTLDQAFDRLGTALFAGVTLGTIVGVLATHRLRHRTVPLGTRVLHGGILLLPMLCLWIAALFGA